MLQSRAHAHFGSLFTQLPCVNVHLVEHGVLEILSKAQKPNAFVKGKEWGRRQGASEVGQTRGLCAFDDLVTRVYLQIPAQKVQNKRGAQQFSRAHPVWFQLL